MWFLDSSSGRGRLTSSLGGKLLPRGLASSGFTGGLFGTGHVDIRQKEGLYCSRSDERLITLLMSQQYLYQKRTAEPNIDFKMTR